MIGVISECIVQFYKFWHGFLHLPGGGALLRFLARSTPLLRQYPVTVSGVGTIRLDFRMDYAFIWLNFLLKESQHIEGLLAVLTSYSSPNMVFWDVGANIGLVSANLFRVFPSARFCLFEPNPDLTERLESLFSTKSGVSIFEIAFSDHKTHARFNIIPGDTSLGSLLPTTNAAAIGIEVELQSGDHFLSAHPDSVPNLIKIDVEGHEIEVIRGCQKLIEAHRPVIVFEHLFLTEDSLKSLTPAGYELLYIHDLSGLCSPVLDRQCSHNALLIPVVKR